MQNNLRDFFKKVVGISLTIITIISLTSTAVFADDKKPISNGISPLSGTFIQPWMYNSWSEERWEEEFTMLKELGMEYLVMGDVAEKTKDSDKWFTFYESKLPEVEKMNYESLDMLFKMCEKHGIKLYLGMGVEHAWWQWDLSKEEDGKKFIEAAKMSVKFADELYSKYKSKYPNAYYGFYSVYEIWNHGSWNNDQSRTIYADYLSQGFNIILDGLNKIDSTMPFLFSPFATPSDDLASLENTKKFWTEFFTKTNFRKNDAFSPMDNIGGGGQTLESVEPWYKAYASAINDSGNKLNFWSNVESFAQPDETRVSGKDGINYWGACTVSRFIDQIDIASKYCQRVFNFAYPHYFSPYNNVAGYHIAYKDYVLTGKKDETIPIPPNKLSTFEEQVDGKTYLKLEWSGEWDDNGIQRVNVYKNGSLLDYRVSSRYDGGTNTPEIPNYIYDTTLSSVTKFMNYEIEVIDCWGNVSQRSKFRVYYDQRNNKINLDESYVSLFKDGKVTISPKPTEAFPTEFIVKDDELSSSSPDINEKMNTVYAVGILIIFSVFVIILLVILFIRRKKKN